MDQATYLSRMLWQFLEASAFTDLTLVCKDGEVAVHSPMLASLLIKIGFTCLDPDQERPECLLMPDHRYFSSSRCTKTIINLNILAFLFLLILWCFCKCFFPLLDPLYFPHLFVHTIATQIGETIKYIFVDTFELASSSSSALLQVGRSEGSPPSSLPKK